MSSSRRRRPGGKGRGKGLGPRAIAAGVAGIAGILWLAKGSPDVAPGPPLALSTAGAISADGPGSTDALPGATPQGPAGSGRAAGSATTPQVPVEAAAALARAADPDPDGIASLRDLVHRYPGSPEADRARAALEQVRARAEGEAARLATAGDAEGALRESTRAYLATLDPTARRARRAEALALADKVVFGSAPTTTMTTYTVAKGDALARIASKHGTDHRLVMRLNRMTNDRIRIGQRLKLPQAPTTVVIYKRDFELVALQGDLLVRAYDVATGKDDRTPESTFKIGNKLTNPDWYSPDGKVFPFGSEGNILGTRWMAFENTEAHQGFGIHGTKFPESIGTEASMGCIRMRNAEVEELYDLLPPGSVVRIVR